MNTLAKIAAKQSPTAKLIRPVYSTTAMGAYDENNVNIADIRKHILHASSYQELYTYLKTNINGRIEK